MDQLNPQQLEEFLTRLKQQRYDQAERLLIEQLHLSATTSKKLVKALSKSDEAMKSFQRNPKIVFADSAEFNEELKSGTSTSFNFNFSSSKIKMTDKDGKTVEIDDQHPDWQEIKKQFNIDLTQPEALSKFAESFIQGQTHNTATQETFSTQDVSASHHSSGTTGVEDLSHQNKSSAIWLLLGFTLLIGAVVSYYVWT
ncbi:hypothetical protein ACG9YX_14850 [Acinetobacter nematophilus]|uniref:hypothetical protein n=1 Tax=Acinetobacter nematophilus TaxID=2994642 RepID=UPI003AF40E11